MENELPRQHDAHVTHLTLNRPHKANALSASPGFLTQMAAQSEWPALIVATREASSKS
jgi:enoyl-CoA hydratase/carnithine racemase